MSMYIHSVNSTDIRGDYRSEKKMCNQESLYQFHHSESASCSPLVHLPLQVRAVGANFVPCDQALCGLLPLEGGRVDNNTTDLS